MGSGRTLKELEKTHIPVKTMRTGKHANSIQPGIATALRIQKSKGRKSLLRSFSGGSEIKTHVYCLSSVYHFGGIV